MTEINLFLYRQHEQKDANRIVKETSAFLKQLSQMHTSNPTEVVSNVIRDFDFKI